MNAFEKLKALIAATERDAAKFYLKGNKAAGTRLRQALQEVKSIAHTGRNEVSTIKKEEAK